MALVYRISLDGVEEVQRLLRRLQPPQSDRAASAALVRSALLVQKQAARVEILPGGRQAPHPTRLTSRTGTGRRSIRVNRTRLPRAIEVGSDLRYMSAHEGGFRGVVQVPSYRRLNHTVRAHSRRMNLPARPFLGPALEKTASQFSGIFVEEIAKRLGR